MTTKPHFTPLGFGIGMPLLWGVFVILFHLFNLSLNI